MGCWIFFLVGYVARQEWTISTGTIVWLQTKPVDPRDFFRGDYVVLNYDISDACDFSTEGYAVIAEEDASGWEKITWERIVYLSLITSGDISIGTTCQYERPTEGLFIKWTSKTYWSTYFGIEKYFVQESSWTDLEQAVGVMKMQVSISKQGKAKIVWYTLE